MASIFENPLQLMMEAAEDEEYNVDNALTAEIADNLGAVFSDIPDVEINLIHSVDMVNVIADEDEYYVEMDDLSKYMLSSNVTDVVEAMNNVASACNIDSSKMTLVVEDASYFTTMLEEAKNDKKKKEKLGKVAKLFVNLKNKGIKIAKKKKK